MLTADQELGGANTPGQVFNQQDPTYFWKECITCREVQPYSKFRRDASYREGVKDQCQACEESPRLSLEEHTFWQREKNLYSEGVKNQRWDHQDDYRGTDSRWGRPMLALDLIKRVSPITRSNGVELFLTEGRIANDGALFRVFGQPQPSLATAEQPAGVDFKYLFYIPLKEWMPEFSIYSFNERDIPVREERRAWRTVLIRLIKAGFVSENQSVKEFGQASGPASMVYRRTLFQWRNQRVA